MALTDADKREIGAMLEAFAYRMGPGRQTFATPEAAVLDAIIEAAKPRIPAFEQRMQQSPGIQRPGDILLSEAISTALVPTRRKKAMSKFNRAVKEGMKIVKASKSYGKAKTINSPKKAFAAVTKTVSKVNRGKVTPKKGVIKKVAAAAAKILTPKSKPKGRSRAQDLAAYLRSKEGKTKPKGRRYR
jgi:hypothetical protein